MAVKSVVFLLLGTTTSSMPTTEGEEDGETGLQMKQIGKFKVLKPSL